MTTISKESVLREVNRLTSNKIVMDFLTKEALEKTASDIREKTGSGTTAKGVELLIQRNKDVMARFQKYMEVGLAACVKLAHA